MATVVPTLQEREIQESHSLLGLKLEEENGQPILRNVKILGSISQNNRFYTTEAKKKALPMYEGIKVNLDHPENPHKTRSIRDRFGKLVHIRLNPADNDLYGDLIFNPHHELAETVKWAASNMPDSLGLSHNAVGQGRDENGKFIVDEIKKVRSVDLVADPATTVTLFESKEPEVKAPVTATVTEEKKPGVVEDATGDPKSVAANEKPVVKSPTPEVVPDSSGKEATVENDSWAKFDQQVGMLVRKIVQNKELSAAQKRKSLLKSLKVATAEELAQWASEDASKGSQAAVESKTSTPTQPTEVNLTESVTTTLTSEVTLMADPLKEARDLLESTLCQCHKNSQELQAEVDKHSKQAKYLDNRKKAQKLVQESKLPAEVVTEYFLDKIANCSSDKEMKDLIEDRKLLHQSLVKGAQVNLVESILPSTPKAPDAGTPRTPVTVSDSDVAAMLRGSSRAPTF